MSLKELVTQKLNSLSEAELQQVAEFVAFLKFRARLGATPALDETQLDVHFVNPSPVFCLDKTGDCSHPKATHMSVLPGSRQGSRLCQSLMLLQ